MKKIQIILALLLFSVSLTAQISTDLDNFYKSVVAKENGDLAAAESFLKQAVAENQNNDFLKSELAKIYFSEQKFDDAINILKQTGNENQNNVNFWLAKAYAEKNMNDSAIYFLKKYLSYYNKLPKPEIIGDTAFATLSETKQWNDLWKKNYYSRAEKLLQEANYDFKYGKLLDALDKTNLLIKKYKKFHKAYFLKGEILCAGNNCKDAVKFYSKAIELSPSTEKYYFSRGKAYLLLKKFKKSAEDFEIYLNKNPYDLSAFYYVALAYEGQKDYDKALEYIDFYAKYFAGDKKIAYKQAEINYKAGNYLETIRILNNLFEKDPYNADYFHLRALAYLEANSFDLSFADFSMCLDLNPEMKDAYYYRGIAQLKMNNIDGACADWKTAIENKDYRANDYFYKYCKGK